MDDPFGTNDGIDDNPNLVQVRDWGKRQAQRAEELDKELQKMQGKLAELESEKQQSTVKDAAREKGLSDEQISTLFTMKPDATADDVEVFAKAVGAAAPAAESTEQSAAEGEQPAPEGEAAEEQPAQSAGFSPVGGSPVPGAPIKWDEIMSAAKRGDEAFLQRVASEALRDPSRVELPNSDLIGEY